MVIEVETSPSGMPANRRSMSATESTATPTLPTSPAARGSSESMPIWVGRSNATDNPVCPASSSARNRSLVASALPKPAYWRMVHGRPRYMVGYGTAREGKGAWFAELRVGIPTIEIGCVVRSADLDSAGGLALCLGIFGHRYSDRTRGTPGPPQRRLSEVHGHLHPRGRTTGAKRPAVHGRRHPRRAHHDRGHLVGPHGVPQRLQRLGHRRETSATSGSPMWNRWCWTSPTSAACPRSTPPTGCCWANSTSATASRSRSTRSPIW